MRNGDHRKNNFDIANRTFRFACRILRLVKVPDTSRGSTIMVRQLARSGTGIGANVEEAQSAQSKAEFARKMNIALSEARESLYWLRLLTESELIAKNRLASISQESEELVKVLTAIVKNCRRNQRAGVK